MMQDDATKEPTTCLLPWNVFLSLSMPAYLRVIVFRESRHLGNGSPLVRSVLWILWRTGEYERPRVIEDRLTSRPHWANTKCTKVEWNLGRQLNWNLYHFTQLEVKKEYNYDRIGQSQQAHRIRTCGVCTRIHWFSYPRFTVARKKIEN
jgi:hypothetical protein